MRTLHDHATALAAGHVTARDLVERCLARIAAPDGEGARVFRTVYAASARAMADAADTLRRAGRAGPYAGIPVSLKDLLDVAGATTLAGSRALADAPPAAAHAPVVERLLRAGFIPIGKTNMTEFAFSGLGINPHWDTPRSPWDRASGRIPGGSSSGAAVSVADGMALGALGTDTGGSCRIPAALCGIAGYKPTARRVPIEGVIPLAPSLDSVGPLAPSVGCCAILDAVLAGEAPRLPRPARLAGLRLAVPADYLLDGMDRDVNAAFERALTWLDAAGVAIEHRSFASFDGYFAANAGGGFAAAEAYAWHRDLIARKREEYDPSVLGRIERGAGMSAADYIDLMNARIRLRAEFDAETRDYDAVLLPTVPIAPPTITDLQDHSEYNRINILLLRNPAIANFMDRCAISLPCARPGDPPAGLMLMGETMGDARLFAIAAAVEAVLSRL